jgi:hypothetical protein
MGGGLKWQSDCFASTKPWVKTQIPPKKKKKKKKKVTKRRSPKVGKLSNTF